LLYIAVPPDQLTRPEASRSKKEKKDEIDLIAGRRAEDGTEFFTSIGRNPLKSPDSEK
jgi:hypothetical protein